MMIELSIFKYLNTALDVPCYMEMPERRTESSFVIIQKTNGSEKNHIKSATFALQSFAPSLYEAAELNEVVKAAMSRLTAETTVCKAELNSDYYFPITGKQNTLNEYRYQAVYNLIYTED